MIALTLGLGLGTRKGASAPVPPATALPQQAAIVARWSADAIPAQADNTALAAWTDSVGSIPASQSTGTRQPKYRTGGQSGKPYVLFSGAQFLSVGNTTNAANVAMATANHTVLVVYRNPAQTTYGILLAASPSGGSYFLTDDGKATGRKGGYWGSGAGSAKIPLSATGIITQCVTGNRPADPNVGRVYINTTGYMGAAARATGALTIGGWSGDPDNYSFSGEIYEVLVWSRSLTPAEVMQAERWVREKYASPLPWAAAGAYRVFHGNSQTDGGRETTPDKRYPATVASLNNWPLGTFTNLGQSGASWDALNAYAPSEIDSILAQLGSTPAHLTIWEYINTGFSAGTNASYIYNRANTYLAARRSAGWLGANKIIFGTSIDAMDGAANYNEATRAAYNAYWDTPDNRTGKMDAYAPIHNDPHIGVADACPNAAPFTPYYYTDGIHLIDAGSAALAAAVAPVMAGL